MKTKSSLWFFGLSVVIMVPFFQLCADYFHISIAANYLISIFIMPFALFGFGIFLEMMWEKIKPDYIQPIYPDFLADINGINHIYRVNHIYRNTVNHAAEKESKLFVIDFYKKWCKAQGVEHNV